MADLNEYLSSRGVTEEQMDNARNQTRVLTETYSLKEVRRASCIAQVELVETIGVS